jgi:hypothetical protein
MTEKYIKWFLPISGSIGAITNAAYSGYNVRKYAYCDDNDLSCHFCYLYLNTAVGLMIGIAWPIMILPAGVFYYSNRYLYKIKEKKKEGD